MSLLSNKNPSAAQSDGKVTVAAAVTAGGAVLACAACCVLPLALPAIGLAGAGAFLAALGSIYRLLTVLGAGLVVLAWLWVMRSSHKSGKRSSPSTIRWLIVATVLALIAALWPWIEALALRLR